MVDEFDIRQVKTALSRLGYYTPHKDIGMNAFADREMFDALKAFQAKNALPETARAKPNDETISRLNTEISKHSEGAYVWRTTGDDKVRGAHATRNGRIFTWDNPPEGGHPGEDHNCRCWAELVPTSFEKDKCYREQENLKKASDKFNLLDRRKSEMEHRLHRLYEKHEKLIEDAKNIFEKNMVLGIVGPDNALSKILDFLTDNVVGNISSDILRENAKEIKKTRTEIKHPELQIALIKAQLDKAAKDVMREKRKLDECQRLF